MRRKTRKNKLEKLVSSDVSRPFRRAVVLVENKVKYLKQKQRRLELYREAQLNGKKLTTFQLSALAKLSQVTRTLEDMRDVHEQFCEIEERTASMQERLEDESVSDKRQQDLAKIRDVLMIQYVLQNMRQDSVREDFLTGQNGAICLTENDLECLDEFYVEISLMNGIEDDVPPFQDQLQQSAEHLLALVNGKVNEVNGTTYAKLRDLIMAIQSCGYFDYVVEDLNSPRVLQETTKEEPEVTVEEFFVMKQDAEADYYTAQDEMALPNGTFERTNSEVPESNGSCSEEPEVKEENPFVCSVCQERFPKRYHLTNHMRSHKKPLCCSVCESGFHPKNYHKTRNRNRNLKRNRNRLSEIYCCEKCDTTFSRKDNLQRHMIIHTDRKPLSCSVCESRFIRLASLKRHMQIHTRGSSFCCSVCGAAFSENSTLKTHMQSHVVKETFKCSVCSMDFNEKCDLDKHVLEHSNTTFSCPVCRAKFSQKSQLGEHILMHL